MESALVALDTQDVARAKESLNAGKKLLLKRLKAVKIADREEFGWAVVRHYESDEIASEISRACRAAAAEVKKQGETASARSPKQRRFVAKPASSYQHSASRPDYRHHKVICFAFGKEGHMQKNCYSKNRKF